jgi:formate dehydrogenase major subunit
MPKRYTRLTRPFVRDRPDGVLHEASWDQALDRVADGFAAARAGGADRTFGMFSCSKASNELNYAAQKFARGVLGSNNVDSCNRT